MKSYLWTKLGTRLQFIKSRKGYPYNWLFFPGGPGLGSESLYPLVENLKLPGTLWCADLPGDGSNTFSNNVEVFKNWKMALTEAVNGFEHVILVGHSSGGMYSLSSPDLENKLTGLVLMDSAPDGSWRLNLEKMMKEYLNEDLKKLEQVYLQNPSNAILKDITVAAAPCFFTKKGLKKGKHLMKTLPYNYESCNWSDQNFDSTYKAKWIPQKLPTLVFAGDQDLLTPLSLFKDLKEFNQPHIMLREIKNAGHFPWMENPREVNAIFNEYVKILIKA